MPIGIHIASDFVTTATLSDDGEFVFYEQALTPTDDPRQLLQIIVDMLDQSGVAKNVSVGVAADAGFKGQLPPPDTAPILSKLNLKSSLQASLGRRVDCISPAQAYALYEARYGASKNKGVSCLLYLDQHVSGGMAFAQHLWEGRNSLAGAWGHMPLGWPVPYELDGRRCWCGRNDCLDSFISAKTIEKEYFATTKNFLTISEIANAAKQNDLIAESALQILEDRIGRTTAMLINILDPDVITLAGCIAQLDRLYINVPRKWPAYTFAGKSSTTLVRATRGSDAIVAGATIFARGSH